MNMGFSLSLEELVEDALVPVLITRRTDDQELFLASLHAPCWYEARKKTKSPRELDAFAGFSNLR